MGNPFYIPPDNTGLNIANMGINFADMLMRRKQADADLSLKRETLAESTRQHNIGSWGTPEAQPGMPTLQQRQVGAQEEQNRIAGAKLGVLGAQFKPTDAAKAIGLARGAGLEKVLEPEITAIKGYGADPQYTMERAHNDFVSNWGEKKADILNRLQDDYAGRLAKDPAFAASKEGKRIETLMNNIYADQDGDFVSSLVFPGVAEAKEMIRRKVRAAQTPVAVVGADGKPRYMSAEEAMSTGAERFVPNTEKKTVSNIQAEVLRKFLDGETLTKEETQIKDKYFRGDKDTYGDTVQRWKAKVDAFASVLGRQPTVDEKRRLFIQDPYGILAPPGGEETPPAPGVPASAIPANAPTATGANGQKIYWDGKNWLDAKTKKVVK